MTPKQHKTRIEQLAAALGTTFKTRIVSDGHVAPTLYVRVAAKVELVVDFDGGAYHLALVFDPSAPAATRRRIGSFENPSDVISLAHVMRSGAWPLGVATR